MRRELRGLVYQNGPDGPWETAERYLSGDVVSKLDAAQGWASLDPAFKENVDALRAALPPPVRLAGSPGVAEGFTAPFGAPWVPAQVYLDFLAHLFPTYAARREGIRLSYAEETTRWVLDADDPATLGSVENRKTLGTKRVTAIELIEDGLRLRAPVVKDPLFTSDGETRWVRNEGETAAAQAKLQEIRERWAAWLPQDPARAAALESAYNHRFNRWRPRKYDGSHLSFPKLALTYQGAPLRLRPHQAAGIQRIMERGDEDDTVGIFYAPGLGKTLCAIVGAVKRIQVGLSSRAVIVVPKSVLGQWKQTFLDVYPDLSDWIMCATDDDFGDPSRRRAFLIRAALGDAPVVLLTYEQFRAIPMRPETSAAYIAREVEELRESLVSGAASGDVEDDEGADSGDGGDGSEGEGAAPTSAGGPAQRVDARADEERRSVAQAEFKKREKKLADFRAQAERRWARVSAAGDADAAWERWCEGGRVCLVIDEFHSFKSLPAPTATTGVLGLPRGESQRAHDCNLKVHYVCAPELFPVVPGSGLRSRGKVVALTGTPVTNSLAEVWVQMRHLQPRLLRRLGLWELDSWLATFTTQVPQPEMDAVGAWRIRQRLKFHNVPEWQRLLDQCWDRVDPKLAEGERPEVYGGRMRVVETPGSQELHAYVQELAARAEAVKKRLVDPSEDNMLKITHDGRVASLFNGPPQTTWPIGRVTKLDAVAREVWDLYCHSDAMSGCQLVFCDLFTPRESSDAARGASSLTAAELFAQQGLYGVLRDKVVAAGCLPGEVAYVHDASTDEERTALFAAANAGKIRVLIGSTQRMGLGVNVQRRAYAAHHVTVPWRPDWLDQANKRVDRDGNLFGQEGGEPVHIVCYPTTGSYDVVLWQMIAQKSEFVAAVNSGTYSGRDADDIGDLQIDASTAMAVALGDLRVVEKVKLEMELSALARRYKAWKSDHSATAHELASLPRQIEEKDREVEELRALRAHCDAHQLGGFDALLAAPMGVFGEDGRPNRGDWERLRDRGRADARLAQLSQSLRARADADGVLVGQYRGLDLVVVRDERGFAVELRHGDGARITCRLAVGGVGTFAGAEAQLASVEAQVGRIRRLRDVQAARLGSLRAQTAAWPHLEEARAKLARYEALCDEVATAGIVDRQRFSFQ